MNGPDALKNVWEDKIGMPDTLAATVKELGGSQAAATLLSVARRTIDRYINREKVGKTKDNRKISETQQTILQDAVQKKLSREVIGKIKENGSLGTSAAGEMRISDEDGYRDTGYLEFDTDVLDDFFDDLEDGDYGAAWNDLQGEMLGLNGYHMPSGTHFTDVEELTLDIPD